MDSSTFVNLLGKLAPSREDFRKYNVSDSYIKEHIGRYICLPILNEQKDIIASDILLNLLQEYDCSKVGIGNLSFLKEVIEYDDYYQIGNVEMDVLVSNKITLEVEVRDHDSLHHTIWPCAANGASLLDALLVCAEYLTSILREDSLEGNQHYESTIISECTEKAGGAKYTDFYKMLLGVDW